MTDGYTMTENDKEIVDVLFDTVSAVQDGDVCEMLENVRDFLGILCDKLANDMDVMDDCEREELAHFLNASLNNDDDDDDYDSYLWQ